jgi:hypothetical protein
MQYKGLTEAKQLFEAGPAEGREGVIHALEAVIKFLILFDPVNANALHTPLARLFDDLMSLGDGTASGMLRPSARSGRSRASGFYDGLKAVTVFTARCLEATGMRTDEARKMVASELTKLRVRPARKGSEGGTGRITERTLRGWQEEIAADIGCHLTAAKTHWGMKAVHLLEVTGIGLPTPPADRLLMCCSPISDLRHVYLDRLASYVARTRSGKTT